MEQCVFSSEAPRDVAMLLLPLSVLAGDRHHAVLGLDCQLLGAKRWTSRDKPAVDRLRNRRAARFGAAGRAQGYRRGPPPPAGQGPPALPQAAGAHSPASCCGPTTHCACSWSSRASLKARSKKGLCAGYQSHRGSQQGLRRSERGTRRSVLLARLPASG